MTTSTLTTKKIPVTANRLLMTGPNQYRNINMLGSGQALPTTQLGKLALQLNQQTNISILSVAATTAYVNAITQSAPPSIKFSGVPAGMQVTVAQLQTAYNTFVTQYQSFQQQAGAWIYTQQNTGVPSIVTQLVQVPQSLSNLAGSVASDFAILNALTPGSPEYNSQLITLENSIGSESPAISTLISSMQSLGTTLQTAETALVASTQPSQILGQLIAAYASIVVTLNAAIASAKQQLSSDDSKLDGAIAGASAAAVVDAVGLANWWNPVGWVTMAAGAVATYYSASEIEALKAEISLLNSQISNNIDWTNQDQTAAQMVSVFCTQLQGFASLNASAQQELSTLENLYSTIASDITTALSNLNANELETAQNEWNTILGAGQVLENLNLYIWPKHSLLSAPSPVAAVGNDIYCVSLSGKLYHYSGSTNSWSDMNVTALSVAGDGTTLVAIDGAPINAASSVQNSSTYFAKVYNMSTQTWTTISNFPVSAVATGWGNIYAIGQQDGKVYQYTSGNNWTSLAQLPGPDAAIQIAVVGGGPFVLSNNSQFVYQYNFTNNTWTQIGASTPYGTLKCSSVTANNTKLAMVATNNYAYLYDPSLGGVPACTGAGVAQIAQLANGDEYRTGTDLSLWFFNSTVPFSYTRLQSNVVGVYASDTGNVYFVDNLGNLYSVNTSTNVATLLPALP